MLLDRFGQVYSAGEAQRVDVGMRIGFDHIRDIVVE